MGDIMKKIKVFLLICVVLSLSILMMSCNKDSKKSLLDPKKPTEITLWHYYFDENKYILESIIDDYNNTVGKEKGIIVKPIAQGTILNLEKTITDSANGVMNAKEMPNIFSSYIDKAVELYSKDKVVDLNDYLTQEDKDKFVPDFLQTSKSGEGNLLIVPILKSTEVLYINKTLFDEFAKEKNIDLSKLKTWAGISEIASLYHNNKNKYSTLTENSFFGFDSLPNYVVMASKQQGLEVVNYELKGLKLDKKVLRNIFDNYFKNIVNGNYYEAGKLRTENLKTGDIIAYIGSSSGAAYFPSEIGIDDKIIPVELEVLPYPNFGNGENCAIQQGAGMAVAVAEPKKVEASVEFLKWFTDYEQNIRFASDSGYLPSVKEAYEKGKFDTFVSELKQRDARLSNLVKVYEVAIEQIRNGKTYAVKPFDGAYECRNILSDTLQDITKKDLEQVNTGNNDLNYDEYFNKWIESIILDVQEKEIPYEEIN